MTSDKINIIHFLEIHLLLSFLYKIISYNRTLPLYIGLINRLLYMLVAISSYERFVLPTKITNLFIWGKMK